MMTIRIRVTKIDVYGFNGRDHHPSVTDEGCDGTVVSITPESGDGGYYEPTEPDEPRHEMLVLTDGHYGPQFFNTQLDNGRFVCLGGHEIQLLSCLHDGDL